MKIYELEDVSKAEHLFTGWQETLIYSCLQKVMGKIYVTDLDDPRSAVAFIGCFVFLAGEPDPVLVSHQYAQFMILVPENDQWESLIEDHYPLAVQYTRYAIRKDTRFDKEALTNMAKSLPEGYELRNIDSEIYDMCLDDSQMIDFVSSFESKEQYLRLGRGVVVLKDGRIIAGASSYTRYNEGIEIEVDTLKDERRKGFATAACAALILQCLEEGLYPSWDAQNEGSLHLARKLGYELDHEYTAYEVI